MSESSLPGSHRRRRSAGARLQAPGPSVHLTDGVADAPDRKLRPQPRRVKSALETRRRQEASIDIFPQAVRSKTDPSWGKTSYREDFGPKAPLSQVPQRPASPTRMNNPHPTEVGCMWGRAGVYAWRLLACILILSLQ